MQTSVRFYTYACVEDDAGEHEIDVVEITESCFADLCGYGEPAPIHYERHTIFANGCDQICLTLEPADYPMCTDLDLAA